MDRTIPIVLTAIAFGVLVINVVAYRRFPNDRMIRPAIAVSALAFAIFVALSVLILTRR